MEIYNFNYKDKKKDHIFIGNSTILLGQFNVFHHGHKELFDKAKMISETNKIGITLFVKEQKNENQEILTLENRLNNLAEIGFNFVLIINFDFDIKSLHAKEFIDNIIEKYNVEKIVVGKDFRFGLNRMWGTNDLKKHFSNTFVCEIKKINNFKISSTSIKEMIKTGEIKLVNELLTSIYNPTIEYQSNKLIWDKNYIKPHSGIYFIKIEIENYWYHGLLHISINQEDKVVLLNYDNDLADNLYTIQIFEELRIIISSRFDFPVEEDKKKCFEFFYNLQKKYI